MLVRNIRGNQISVLHQSGKKKKKCGNWTAVLHASKWTTQSVVCICNEWNEFSLPENNGTKVTAFIRSILRCITMFEAFQN